MGRQEGARGGEGFKQYYVSHIHDLQLQLRNKMHNLNRLEAQRNDYNARGIHLCLCLSFFGISAPLCFSIDLGIIF